MTKVIVVYHINDPKEDTEESRKKMDAILLKAMKENGFDCMGSGYNFLKNERDLSFEKET